MNDLALTLHDIAARIRTVLHKNIIEIGDLLTQAKAMLPHGEFQEWAERELNIKPRSAQNYMRAAEFVRGKSETVACLPPHVLYKLAAPNAPSEIVQKVNNAEVVDTHEIIAAIERYQDQQRDIRAYQKQGRSPRNAKKAAEDLARRKAKIEAEAEAERRQALMKVQPVVQRIEEAGLSADLLSILDDWALKRALTEALGGTSR